MLNSCKKIFCIALLSVVAILVLTVCGRLGYNYVTDNVHTVIPGKIYRSAQLDHRGLAKYTEKLHLKTIINLRGAWSKDSWYQVESRFAKNHHLNYYPIQFSAYDLPNKKHLYTLIQLLQTAPTPLIFHCEGGADRTGMAAAISIILFEPQATLSQIKHQISWYFNAISPKTTGYQLMRNYFAWLKAHHYRASNKTRFLEWVSLPAKWQPYHGWFVM